MMRATVAALVLSVALPARSQNFGLPMEDTAPGTLDLQALGQTELPKESPRWGNFQMSLGGYRPSIDSEFRGSATPYETVFGGGRNLMFRADVAYSLLIADHGTVDLGIGAGYWSKSGNGRLADGSVSSDETSLKIIPTRISVTYRFDWLANNLPIPLAPYARFSFDRYWWWVTNGSGGTANAGGKKGSGGTNGYSVSGGINLLLDFIDRQLAREMDRDTGINHTYLFVDFTKSYISDFGSSSSWNLSDDRVTISGGLLFVF